MNIRLDDQEPTPRVGPCIEDTGLVEKEEASIAYSMLEPQEYNIVDLLLYSTPENVEVYARVFIGLECLNVLSLHIRGCGEKAVEMLKKYSDKPEFYKIIMEGNCIELIAPHTPTIRLIRALSIVGAKTPLPILAYRKVEKFVLDDEQA